MGWLEIKTDDRVRKLTLNRAEKRNALSADLCLELVEAMEAADRDPNVRAILLLGTAPAFCAGMDLSEIGSITEERIQVAHERLFTMGARLTTPLVAGVAGPALGGGTGLVANCHIVVASEAATFGLTEIRFGLWPFLVYRPVEDAVGKRRALELALTGRVFGAREALELGLVHEITPHPEVRAASLAQAIAGACAMAVHTGMAFVHKIRGAGWAEAANTAARMRGKIFESSDFREGLRAFLDKRR